MPLKFKALRYNNNSTPITLKETQFADVEELPTGYKVPDKKVLVRVHYAALNPIDFLLKNAATCWIFRGERGFASDYSGEVVALGAEAAKETGLKVGDRVNGLNQIPFGNGTAAQYTLVDPFSEAGCSIRKTPDSLPLDQAASYPLVLGTAQSFFNEVDKKNALKKVLIIGAGTSVGRYTVQLAKKVYNVGEVVVTCSGKSADLITSLGADKIIDYTKHKSILQPVLELVKESGKFDAIFDCAGNSDLFPEILNIIQDKAHHGYYGSIAGDSKLKYGSDSLTGLFISNLNGGIRLLASRLGYYKYNYHLVKLHSGEKWADKAIKYQSELGIVNSIDSEWPADEYQKALDRLASNRASGKVLIKFAD
uniref:Enoyl reductase (ER) domain-containing protein n=1 Tax=Candidozyma auris TaxID=498019 RepID=A0A0L0NZ83_CANAR